MGTSILAVSRETHPEAGGSKGCAGLGKRENLRASDLMRSSPLAPCSGVATRKMKMTFVSLLQGPVQTPNGYVETALESFDKNRIQQQLFARLLAFGQAFNLQLHNQLQYGNWYFRQLTSCVDGPKKPNLFFPSQIPC